MNTHSTTETVGMRLVLACNRADMMAISLVRNKFMCKKSLRGTLVVCVLYTERLSIIMRPPMHMYTVCAAWIGARHISPGVPIMCKRCNVKNGFIDYVDGYSKYSSGCI